MGAIRIGVQLQPQHTSMADLRDAWQRADTLGVDSIWVWDHFYPLYGDPDGAHFEGWSIIAAMAADTRTAKLGAMVSCNTYRNPDLLADMARTVDHISGGRLYLGLGSGWFERDYVEYGYPFTTGPGRQAALVESLGRITARFAKLNPPPLGPMPIMLGASGERVGLRIVAEHADAWNTFGLPELYAHKNAVLTDWCVKVGRDPATIERTVLIMGDEQLDQWRDYVAAGAEHIIVGVDHPFDLEPVERLMGAVRAS